MSLPQRKTPRLKGYDSILTNPARWNAVVIDHNGGPAASAEAVRLNGLDDSQA